FDGALDLGPLGRALGIGVLASELLPSGLVVPELVLQVVPGLLERALPRHLRVTAVVRLELRVELLDDHRRAPGGLLLRPENVTIDVVADVEDARPGHAETGLEVLQVASLVDLAALERPFHVSQHRALALEEWAPFLEPVWLLRGDHDDVE